LGKRWEFIVENECITGYNESLNQYFNLMKKSFVQDKPRPIEEVFGILQVRNKRAKKKLKRE